MNRRFLSIILTILTMSVLLTVTPILGLTANAAELPTFSGGSGTDASPYKISTAADLKALAEAVNSGAECKGIYFQLTKDIDLSGYSPWTPIGSFDNQFTGIFDGNGCKITGLTINDANKNNQGLFGYVGGGTVKKLGVVGTVTGKNYVGGIVGVNFGGTIEDCYNACTVTGNKYVGGVVGHNFHGTVKNCYNVGTISGGEYVGGVVGDTQNESDIQSCYNTGTVNHTASSNFGGVVGNDEDSSIDDTWDFAGSGSAKPTDGNVWTESEWSGHPVLNDNHLTVTFDPNYDGASEDQKHKYDVDYGSNYGTPPTPSPRDGYTFDGWYTGSEDGDEINTNGKTITESQTFYAHWTLEEYEIEYVLNESAGEVVTNNNPERYTIKDTPITLEAPTREGYDFLGWYDADPDTPNAKKVTGIEEGSTGKKTFWAKWEEKSYTITYDPGEYGSGITQIKKHGVDINLSAREFTRTGYTHTGWATKSGGEKVYEFGELYTKNEDVKLYPAWEANTYDVIYHIIDTDGTEEYTPDPAYTTYTYDSPLTLPDTTKVTLTKVGHILDGWYTTNDCTGEPIKTLPANKFTNNIDLYAKWTVATYTVTYEKNGGTITNENNYTKYTYGVGLPELPTPTRTGYEFDGWYDESNSPVTEISTTDTGNKTFYAKWTANTYTVFYHIINDDTGFNDANSSGRSYTYDDIPFDLPTPTKTGHTLDGWYTNANCTGTKIKNLTAKESTSETINLYAKWVPAKYNVTFDTNGGNFTGRSIIEEQYEYGTGMKTLPKVERVGYTFDGWYDKSNGKLVTEISDNATGDIELYAKWTANEYEVTFEPNGGEISNTKITVIYDEKYGDLPEPSFTGHTFSGWFTGGNVEIKADTYVTIANDHTLYAHYDECKHEGMVWKADNNKTHSGTCDICGKLVTEDHHWGEGEITKEATETEKGERTYTCKDCKRTKTEAIPATGNNSSRPSSGGNSTPSTGGDTESSGGNGAGGVNIDFVSGKNAPDIKISKDSINKLKKEVVENHLTTEEQEAIENGTVIDIILSVKLVKDSEAIEDKQAVEAVLADSEYVIGVHLNIELIKKINGKQVGKITELSSPIRVIVDIPENLRNENREFETVRVHNGEAAILEDADKKRDTITIVTDKFSTYSIAYRDIMAYNPDTGLTTPIAIITLAGAIIVTAVAVKKKKMN